MVKNAMESIYTSYLRPITDKRVHLNTTKEFPALPVALGITMTELRPGSHIPL